MATSVHPQTDPKPLRIEIGAIQGLPVDLEDELAEGRIIELVRGEKVIAQVCTAQVPRGKITAANFDWEAQRRQMWGDRVFDVDTTQWIREDRDADE